jgi:hypothetical protein
MDCRAGQPARYFSRKTAFNPPCSKKLPFLTKRNFQQRKRFSTGQEETCRAQRKIYNRKNIALPQISTTPRRPERQRDGTAPLKNEKRVTRLSVMKAEAKTLSCAKNKHPIPTVKYFIVRTKVNAGERTTSPDRQTNFFTKAERVAV